MAVSTLRTLLTAHSQAGSQRTLRELGKSGAWMLGLSLGVLALFVVIPAIVGSGVLGYVLARHLEGLLAPAALGLLLTALSLGAGLVSGLLGGARQLSWESYRTYPVPPLTLFVAELIAGLGDWWNLLVVFALSTCCAGVVLARPGLLLLVGGVWLGCVLLLLVTQLVVSGLTAAVVRRFRVALLFLLAGIWALSALAPALGQKLNDRGLPREVRQERLAALKETGMKLLAAAEWLPGVASARGLGDAVRGDWRKALAHQAYPLGLTLVLTACAYLLSRRESGPERATGKGRDAPPWRFRTPAGGIARLQWTSLMGSVLGKTGFLLPLIVLVLLQGPFSRGDPRSLWVIPAAFAYTTLGGSVFHLNQFGLDGHGVKALLLLPISAEDVLRGKAWGLWAYQGCQAAIVLFFLVLLKDLHPADLAAGVCFGACIGIAQSAVGQWTSAWMPRRIQPNAMSNKALPPAVGLINLAVTAGSFVVFGGLYVGVASLAPVALLPVMALAVAGAYTAHARLQRHAAAYVDRRRETLVEALG